MADGCIKLEGVQVTQSKNKVVLLFGDKTTIDNLPSDTQFSVTVDWGCVSSCTETHETTTITHEYTTEEGFGVKNIKITGGWSDGNGNTLLSFPKCDVKRVTNYHIRPWKTQQLTTQNNRLMIKFSPTDYVGLTGNKMFAKKNQNYRFKNNTGNVVTIGDTEIQNNQVKVVKMPNVGDTVTITGTGFADQNIKLKNGFWQPDNVKVNNLVTATHSIESYPYNLKTYNVGGANVKLTPANVLAKKITINGNFKIHGEGDFAGFNKLNVLSYDKNLTGNKVGWWVYNGSHIDSFKYTFMGCKNLNGFSNLITNMICKPSKLIGVFSGMSLNKSKTETAKWKTPPEFATKKGDFTNVDSIDYMMEYSNFNADISTWNFTNDKISSSVGLTQYSNYSHDISNLASKLTTSAVKTDMFKGNNSIASDVKNAFETYNEPEPPTSGDQPSAPVDTDGDGVADSDDDFPHDPAQTSVTPSTKILEFDIDYSPKSQATQFGGHFVWKQEYGGYQQQNTSYAPPRDIISDSPWGWRYKMPTNQYTQMGTGNLRATMGFQWKLKNFVYESSNPAYYVEGDDGVNGQGFYYPVYLNTSGLNNWHHHVINGVNYYMENNNANHAKSSLPSNNTLPPAPQ